MGINPGLISDMPLLEGHSQEQWERMRADAPPSLVTMLFPLKAGGTMLRELLCRSMACKRVRGSYLSGGFEERNLYLPELLEHQRGDQPKVLHNHACGTSGNVDICKGLNLRPVLMRRNILDSLHSLYREREKAGDIGCWGSSPGNPTFFKEFSLSEQKDYMIEMLGPWFIRYYVTWERADVDKLWLRFVDYKKDPLGAARKILKRYGQPETNLSQHWEEIWADRGGFKFNKGLNGEGLGFFGRSRANHLMRLARYSGLRLNGLVFGDGHAHALL